MTQTVRITVRVRPYRWKDFVNDAIFAFSALIIISDRLSRRYLRRSLLQLIRLALRAIKWAYWVFILSFFGWIVIGSLLELV